MTSLVYKQSQHSQTNKYPHNDAWKSSSIKQHEVLYLKKKQTYGVSSIKFTELNTKFGLYNEHNSANQCLRFLQISLVDQRSLFSNFCLWGIQHECFIEVIQIHESVRQKSRGTVKHPKTTHSPSSLDFLSQDAFGPFVSNARWQ